MVHLALIQVRHCSTNRDYYRVAYIVDQETELSGDPDRGYPMRLTGVRLFMDLDIHVLTVSQLNLCIVN